MGGNVRHADKGPDPRRTHKDRESSTDDTSSSQDPLYCPHCGWKGVYSDDNYCSECGESLNGVFA